MATNISFYHGTKSTATGAVSFIRNDGVYVGYQGMAQCVCKGLTSTSFTLTVGSTSASSYSWNIAGKVLRVSCATMGDSLSISGLTVTASPVTRADYNLYYYRDKLTIKAAATNSLALSEGSAVAAVTVIYLTNNM